MVAFSYIDGVVIASVHQAPAIALGLSSELICNAYRSATPGGARWALPAGQLQTSSVANWR